MEHRNREDEKLRELFKHARQADRAITPGFHELVETGRRPARRSYPARRYAGLGLATSLALAAWLVLRAPSAVDAPPLAPSPPPAAKPAVSPSVAPPLVAPPPVAPPPVAVPKVPQSKQASATAPNETQAGLISDLPIPGRFYQNVLSMAPDVADSEDDGNVAVRGSRMGDFKVMAGGVTNVDPLRGVAMNSINPDSIEEIVVVSSGAGTRYGRAQGGYRNVAKRAIAEPQFNTESYAPIRDNELQSVRENPLSTFSIDVDTASYSNVRRFLKEGSLPPRDAVRVEELINYFPYDYPAPGGDAPFSASVEIAACPWSPAHRLARIGLKGREIERGESKGSNLVFLIDVSGSMDEPAKLPLLQKSLALLVNELDGSDDVAIVVYAGASGVVLPPTSGANKSEIRASLERLRAGGGTNGGEGLALAYKLAREGFIAGGINRVILATDGDFNLGITSQTELLKLIEDDARHGIFLTVLGFGMGNYKDSTLELLADHGNGNYAYIDDLREARKVLVEQSGGTLVTIAKDVKIQVEFNPAQVAAYRLVGYENRLLRKEEFNDDRKDAGEIGAGHTVTALYEIVPAGAKHEVLPAVDPLKYQAEPVDAKAAASGELLTLKLRYKEPEGSKSRLLSFPVTDAGHGIEQASPDFKFAAAVADFGLQLRQGSAALAQDADRARRLALEGIGADAGGYRAEFLQLVDRARGIDTP